jgi:hypothetical protein
MRAFFTIAIVVTMAALGLGGASGITSRRFRRNLSNSEYLNLSISQLPAPASQTGASFSYADPGRGVGFGRRAP